MEVLFDLDTEARDVCAELRPPMQRAATVGTHPDFVEGLRQMIEERACGQAERPALGTLEHSHDVSTRLLPARRPSAKARLGANWLTPSKVLPPIAAAVCRSASD